MPPRSARRRALALGLELLGVAGVIVALARVNPWLALGVAGVVLIAAAQFAEELL